MAFVITVERAQRKSTPRSKKQSATPRRSSQERRAFGPGEKVAIGPSSASMRLSIGSSPTRRIHLSRGGRASSTRSAPALVHGRYTRQNGRESSLPRRLVFCRDFRCLMWCPGAESNHRHRDFQSRALPTELPGRRPRRCGGSQSAGRYRGSPPVCPARGEPHRGVTHALASRPAFPSPARLSASRWSASTWLISPGGVRPKPQ